IQSEGDEGSSRLDSHAEQELCEQASFNKSDFRDRMARTEWTGDLLAAEAVEKDKMILQAFEQQKKMNPLVALVAERQSAVEALEAQLTEQQQRVDSLVALVAERQGAVESLAEQLAERHEKVLALTDLVAERQRVVESLTSQLAEAREKLAECMVRIT